MYSSKTDLDKNVKDGNPQLHSIFSSYVGITLCVLGLCGNFISLLVWRRLNKRRYDSGKSAGIFLISLAVIDSGLLIFFILSEGFVNISSIPNHRYEYIWFYCYVGFPMYFFFIVASIWMVISITYNRFIAVVFPHKAAVLNTVRKSYVIIGCTLLFSFTINIPHFFFFHPTLSKSGEDSWVATKTNFGKTNAATMYSFWGHCMFLVLFPWILITLLNGAIIYNLYKNKKLRVEQHSKRRKFSKEHQTTVILLTVSFTFLFFLIWQCIAQCFYMLHYKSNDSKVWFNVSTAYAPAQLGYVLFSSVNFILYCLSGQMFRKEMYRMFAEVFGCMNYLVLNDVSTTMSKTSQISSTRSEMKESINSIKSNCDSVVAWKG